MVAVCDRDLNKAIQFKQTWRIPQSYDSVEDMFEASHPDVVHVLLPPAAHAAEAIRCLEHGSHVFVEWGCAFW